MPTSAHPQTLNLTIRATNGALWPTDEFHVHQKVALVIRKSVAHFVADGAMTDGDYAIALLGDDGTTHLLSDASSLEDASVPDHATLVLVTREPQIDG